MFDSIYTVWVVGIGHKLCIKLDFGTYRMCASACADPERFFRGGPALTKFFVRGERTRKALKACHNRLASETPTLNADFSGDPDCITKECRTKAH